MWIEYKNGKLSFVGKFFNGKRWNGNEIEYDEIKYDDGLFEVKYINGEIK